MPTTRIRYVNPASAGGDGTTTALSGANAAYASLNAAAGTEVGNIVASDEIVKFVCQGTTADTSWVDVSGWTTDAARFVWFQVDPASRHNGTWSTGKYRLTPSNAAPFFDIWGCDHVRIEGFQIQNSPANAQNCIHHNHQANGAILEVIGCYIEGTGGTPLPGMYGVAVDGNNFHHTLRVRNSIIRSQYDSVYVRYQPVGDRTVILYNVTLVDPQFFGVILDCDPATNNVFRLKNVLVQGTTGTNYFLGNADTTDYANCISEDASSPITGLRNKTVVFVNEAGGDFHLDPSDTTAKDAGTNLSSDPFWAFTDDIDGETRSGAWDIGADEVATVLQYARPISDDLVGGWTAH